MALLLQAGVRGPPWQGVFSFLHRLAGDPRAADYFWGVEYAALWQMAAAGDDAGVRDYVDVLVQQHQQQHPPGGGGGGGGAGGGGGGDA